MLMGLSNCHVGRSWWRFDIGLQSPSFGICPDRPDEAFEQAPLRALIDQELGVPLDTYPE